MNRSRLGGYFLVMLALFGVLLGGSRAWATPGQARPGQGISVPSRTPTTEWSPPSSATSRPTSSPTDRPQDGATATPLPPRATPASPASPMPATYATTTPAEDGTGAALALVMVADRLQAWPGATVFFTLILSNPSVAPARQIVLEDALPVGLDPGTVQGESAAWDGRTLRARVPLLAPGDRWVVVFSAIVREDATAGRLLVNSAQASAAGGLNAQADAYLALPPAELPAVGGSARNLRLLP